MNIRKTKVKDKINIKPTPDNRIKKVCPVCSKEFFGQGYGGHMWNKHQQKVGPKAELQQLKIKLNSVLKEAVDHKNCIPKTTMVTCPQCNKAGYASNWKIIKLGGK